MAHNNSIRRTPNENERHPETTPSSSLAPPTATSRASSPSKRKAKSKDPYRKKKTFNDPDQEHFLKTEAQDLLYPMMIAISEVLSHFSFASQTRWYEDLEKTATSYSGLFSNITNRQDILNHDFINRPFLQVENMDSKVVERFEKMEAIRTNLVKVLNKGLPTPSAYGYYWNWGKPGGPRTSRDQADQRPLAMEFHSGAFLVFKELMVQRSPLNDDTYNMVAIGVAKLLEKMPQIFESHSDRVIDFMIPILEIFPNDENFQWFSEKKPYTTTTPDKNPANISRTRIDLVYKRKDTHAPVLMVEVKLEIGVGGDPFMQNGRLYQLYVDEEEGVRQCGSGAPVFLLQLAGTSFSVGGGFCDTLTGSPVIQQFGGYVTLEPDDYDQNLEEMARRLYSIKEAIAYLPKTHHPPEEDRIVSGNIPDLPHIYPSYLKPLGRLQSPSGSLYRAILYPDSQSTASREAQSVAREQLLARQDAEIQRLKEELAKAERNSEITRAAIHRDEVQDSDFDEPRLVLTRNIFLVDGKDRYSTELHSFLAAVDLAPALLRAPTIQGKANSPVAKLCVMELLDPPDVAAGKVKGWISLGKLGLDFPNEAGVMYEAIKTAVLNIVSFLEEAGFVHGDLRPNNIMINISIVKVEDGPPTCILENNKAGDPPYLKVVDFKWGGKVGTTFYPPNRDPSVPWPSSNRPYDMSIGADHDRRLVLTWLKGWPPAKPEPTPQATLTYLP